jgi:hypothetical protein
MALAVVLASVVLTSAAQPLKDTRFVAPLPLSVGERLSYDVRFGKIAAGQQSLQVVAKRELRGTDVYELRSESLPSALLSKVYNFHDAKTSFVAAANLLPIRYEKEIEDRRYRANFVVDFDRSRNRATIWRDGNRQQREPVMPEDVLDELSMVYHLRTKDLIPGNRYEYSFFTGTKLYDVTVEALRYEYYTAPAPLGRVKVLRLRASDGFSAWITADAYRIPVRIEAPLKISAKLTATIRAWSGVRGLPSFP